MRYVKLYEYVGQPVAILGSPSPDGWRAFAWDEGSWRPASPHAMAARLLGQAITSKSFVARYPAAACALPLALEHGTGVRVAR
jgi:hypothetical protein